MKLSGEVVVTGAAGAIGSNLVRRILREPEVTRVFCIDDLSAGHLWLLPPAHEEIVEGPAHGLVKVFNDPRLEWCQQSILKDDLLRGHKEPDAPIVFHLAAHFANALSVEEPVEDTMINVVGTVAMLDWAQYWGCRHFVFASAGCAAGHTDTPYQVGKAAGEAYCRYYFDRVPSTVFQFHNSFGPGEIGGPYRNVIPNFMLKASNGEPLTIFGDGSDRRDFVYVDDVVEDLVNAEASRVPQEIGTGVLTSVRDLAWALCEEGNVHTTFVEAPRRRWDHAGRAAVVDRRSRVELREGLRRTWAWFRANESKIRESIR